MNASVQSYPARVQSSGNSRLTAILRRAPLVMLTFIFTMIAVRYLANPVREAASLGIAFTSPGGMTTARVGFAAFPLSIAIFAFSCLLSPRRLLAGLYMVLIVDGVVIAMRIAGIVLDHSAAFRIWLLVPETVLLTLSLIAIRLETARTQGEIKA
jgi:hypothetical protein